MFVRQFSFAKIKKKVLKINIRPSYNSDENTLPKGGIDLYQKEGVTQKLGLSV